MIFLQVTIMTMT